MRVNVFWRQVNTSAGPENCWLWTGRIDPCGYGRYSAGNGAHRVAYELVNGPIPVGLEIDHLCSNPPCVNPRHLEAVTREENDRRRVERRTHCKRGHRFTPETTYGSDGKRRCAICMRDLYRARCIANAIQQRPHVAPAVEVRSWAKTNGVDCPQRGRVPAAVREAYETTVSL